jgi:shikimate dehydrogenase
VNKHVILVGFMGSGKSTVGKLYAQQNGLPLYDCDQTIVEMRGMNIPDIFSNEGETAFRKYELEALKATLAKPLGIVITGGGIVSTDEGRKLLTDIDAATVWLRVSFEDAAKRVQEDRHNQRPLFADLKKAEKLFLERQKWYQQVAGFTLDTDATPQTIVDNLISLLHPNAKRCYIIGDPVTHSFSPYLHNRIYRDLGIDDAFCYQAEHVTPDELSNAAGRMRIPNVRGVSVTVPHKVTIMKYLDKIDPLAEKVGAVNTVVNENGVLHGYNTDAEGVVLPLLEHLGKSGLNEKQVLVIGAGGAARAAVFGLRQADAEIAITNRTIEKAQTLAEASSSKVLTVDKAMSHIDTFDIIFNATSVGMGKPGNTDTPLPNVKFSKDQIVFDAVYSPHETQLLRDAKHDGAAAIYGIEMLGTQAIGQIKRYTGHSVDLQTVMKILKDKLSS